MSTQTALKNPLQNLSALVRIYGELSKSGIVTLVLISVLSGYVIGHPFERSLDPLRLLQTLIGVLFLAAGSSALNQLQESHLDARMPRTAKRPLPSGRLTLRHARVVVISFLLLGLWILATLSVEVLAWGVLAVVLYNGAYTLWWKRNHAYAAIPGAIPGALPILMGYAAAHGTGLTPAGIYLFLILFYWQMPHFWVLALRFQADYALGGIPTLPVRLGEETTRYQIGIWTFGYVGLALLAPLFLGTGGLYCVAATLVSAGVLLEFRKFWNQPTDRTWLRFFLAVNFSLIVYLALAAIDLWHVYLIPWFTR